MPHFAGSRPVRDNSVDPFGEFALGVREQIFYLVYQLAHRRDKMLDARLALLGISVAHWRSMSIIRRVNDCSMSALARFSTVDRTTLTRSVDQLVTKGLVERHIPANDRRVVLLSLTEAGHAIYDQAVQCLIAVNSEILAGAPQVEQRELARALEAVLRAAIADPREAADIATFARSHNNG
jgi:DNA-binding MarR family transcriptional regulator